MFSVGHSEEFVDGKWVHRERVNFKEVWPQVQSGKLNYAGVGWYQGEQKPQTLLWYYHKEDGDWKLIIKLVVKDGNPVVTKNGYDVTSTSFLAEERFTA